MGLPTQKPIDPKKNIADTNVAPCLQVSGTAKEDCKCSVAGNRGDVKYFVKKLATHKSRPKHIISGGSYRHFQSAKLG